MARAPGWGLGGIWEERSATSAGLTLLWATGWRKWPVGMDPQDQFLQGLQGPHAPFLSPLSGTKGCLCGKGPAVAEPPPPSPAAVIPPAPLSASG